MNQVGMTRTTHALFRSPARHLFTMLTAAPLDGTAHLLLQEHWRAALGQVAGVVQLDATGDLLAPRPVQSACKQRGEKNMSYIPRTFTEDKEM